MNQNFDNIDPRKMGEKEIEALREKTISEARLAKTFMLSLIEQPAFKYYVQELQAQFDRRQKAVLQLPMGVDQIIQQQCTLGEMAGIQLAIDLPNILREYAQAAIESANIKQEEKGNGKTTQEFVGDDLELDFGGRGTAP